MSGTVEVTSACFIRLKSDGFLFYHVIVSPNQLKRLSQCCILHSVPIITRGVHSHRDDRLIELCPRPLRPAFRILNSINAKSQLELTGSAVSSVKRIQRRGDAGRRQGPIFTFLASWTGTNFTFFHILRIAYRNNVLILKIRVNHATPTGVIS